MEEHSPVGDIAMASVSRHRARRHNRVQASRGRPHEMAFATTERQGGGFMVAEPDLETVDAVLVACGRLRYIFRPVEVDIVAGEAGIGDAEAMEAEKLTVDLCDAVGRPPWHSETLQGELAPRWLVVRCEQRHVHFRVAPELRTLRVPRSSFFQLPAVLRHRCPQWVRGAVVTAKAQSAATDGEALWIWLDLRRLAESMC